MNRSIQNIIESRTSINHFQPNLPLSENAITSLVFQATRAPSAYNLQNWRFIAVRSEQGKIQLLSAAYGQEKIMEASVSFIICGSLAAHKQLALTLQPNVAVGILSQHIVDGWVAQACTAYENDLILQRDEAIRSASLAAMTLMLAAQNMGLGSCPIGGFNAKKVSCEFNLNVDEIPVIIVTVGYPTTDNGLQKLRKPLSEILTII